MRTSKRILVLFIALIMIFSSMQGGLITAFAADEPGIENDGGNEILAPPEEGEEATDVAVESADLEDPTEAAEVLLETELTEMSEEEEKTEPADVTEAVPESESDPTEETEEVTDAPSEEADPTEPTEPTEKTEPTVETEPEEVRGAKCGIVPYDPNLQITTATTNPVPASEVPLANWTGNDNPIIRAYEYLIKTPTGSGSQVAGDIAAYNAYKSTSNWLNWRYATANWTGIGYDHTQQMSTTGQETTSAGLPDVQQFRNGNGFVCGSFLAYIFFNYLPNVEGIYVTDQATLDAFRSTNLGSVRAWDGALGDSVMGHKEDVGGGSTSAQDNFLRYLVENDEAEILIYNLDHQNHTGHHSDQCDCARALIERGTETDASIQNLTLDMHIGDIVVYDLAYNTGDYNSRAHVAVYVGNGCVLDCGNDNGPQIRSINSLKAASGSSGSGANYIRIFRFKALAKPERNVGSRAETRASGVAIVHGGNPINTNGTLTIPYYNYLVGANRTAYIQAVDLKTINGAVVYCLAPEMASEGQNYTIADQSAAWMKIPADKRNAMGLVMAYGYPNQSYSASANDIYWYNRQAVLNTENYIATQLILWEILAGVRSSQRPYALTGTTSYRNAFDSGWNTIRTTYDAIVSKLANHNDIPAYAAHTQGEYVYELKYDSSTGTYRYLLPTERQSDWRGCRMTLPDGITYLKASDGQTVIGFEATVAAARALPQSGYVVTGTSPYVEIDPDTVGTSWMCSNSQPVIMPVSVASAKAFFTLKASSTVLEILKVDKSTGQPLPGAVLKIQKKSGTSWVDVRWASDNTVVQWTSTSAAKVFTDPDWLVIGQQYRLFEVTAPDGYEKFDPIEFKLSQAGEKKSLRAEDPKKDLKLTIKKVDPNGVLLPHAGLELYKQNGSNWVKVAAWNTEDENPKSFNSQTNTWLTVGRYKLIEVDVPDPYIAFEDIVFDVTEDNYDIPKEVTAINGLSNSLSIMKVTPEGQPLPGATLKIQRKNGNVWQDVRDGGNVVQWSTTDENPKTFVDPPWLVMNAQYRLYEVEAPEGYQKFTPIEFKFTESDWGKTKVLRAVDPRVTTLAIRKVDENGVPLAGATLKIQKRISGSWVDITDEWETTAAAKEFSNPQWLDTSAYYRLVEVEAPPGYEKFEPIEFQITNSDLGKTKTLTAVDKKTYTVTVRKVNGADPECLTQLAGNQMYSLEGARFEIYANGVYSETVTTDASGYATSSKQYISGTSITAKEIEAPRGFILNDQPSDPIIVDKNSTNTVTIADIPMLDPQGLTIHKVDSKTERGTGQGDASLKGAVFKMEYYDNENWTGSPTRTWYFETDADGKFEYKSSYLASGYTSTALYVSPSPTTDENRYQIPLGTFKLTEEKAPPGYMAITEPLYGMVVVQGEGSSASAHATWRSGTNIEEMTGHETDGEWALDEEVEHLGSIEIRKIDVNSGSTPQGEASLAGAVFSVYNRSTNAVQLEGNDPDGHPWPLAEPGDVCYWLITDANGYASSVERIFPVGTYEIKETTPPPGYTLNTTWSKTFTVHEVEAGHEAENDFSYVSDAHACANTPIKGGVQVIKVSSVLGNATDADAKLEGITFSIYNESTNSVWVNGTEYAPGSKVAEIALAWDAAEGKWIAKSANNLLPYGDYYIQENCMAGSTTMVNPYYKVDTTKIHFQIREDGVIVPNDIHNSENRFENEPELYGKIYKGIAEGSEGTLTGWTFDVYKGTIKIGSYTTNETETIGGVEYGVITVKLPIGRYTVKEQPKVGWVTQPAQTLVVDGHSFADNPATVFFSNNEKTKLKIIKQITPGATGTVEGWQFEVKQGSTVIGTFTTNTEGVILEDIPAGTYTIHEIPKENWIVQEDQTVTITDANTYSNPATVTFINAPILYGKIYKGIAEGSEGSLLGWTFDVYDGATKIGTYETKTIETIGGVQYGVTDVFELPHTGDYTVKEQPQVGWVGQPDQTLTASWSNTIDSPATVFFANNAKTKLQIIKKLAPGATGTVEGWQFEVKQGSTVIGTFTTNAEGVILEDIPAGTYTIHEIPKDHWIVQEDQTVEVTDANTIGNPATVTFVNTPLTSLKIIKTSEDGIIAGITFEIYDDEDEIEEGNYLQTVTTGADGTIQIDDLTAGTYYVKEIVPPQYLPQDIKTVVLTFANTIDNPATVSFVNSLNRGRIEIYKTDASGHALAGATFLLEYSEDGETWLAVRPATTDDHDVGTCPDVADDGTITTGADGKAIFTELNVFGIVYRLTETKAPNGYQLLKEPIMVGALTDEDADGTYEYTAQVVNVSVLEMPVTGGPGNLALNMMFTIIAGAAILTLCTVLYRRRRTTSANS